MSKQRAINTGPKSVVAVKRFEAYKSTWKRINESIEDGYFLESITLIESIISDRLEARIAILNNQNHRSFLPLGDNVSILLGKNKKSRLNKETDPGLITLLNKVDDWKKKRNEALHEMVKVPDSNALSWDDKYAESQSIAKEGIELARAVSNIIKKLNKLNKPV
ncbi:MAG: hypothetical protein HUU54_12850 [Ignavibacteriaceae bacterium]|nr:hypothetical protein [Ignavibacteriaceae bacterium]